jgi:Thioredoxin
MNTAVLALGMLGAVAPSPAVAQPLPAATSSEVRPKSPMLLGETTAAAILANRAQFRDNLTKVKLAADLRARWKAIQRPFTLVAVFGSWCGDSHRQLPELLALQTDPNPFIEVHYLGVNRDKALEAAAWPRGCAPQIVDRVPTFYLFSLQPGGGQASVGSVVEIPPKAGQTMAEALVELVEAGTRLRQAGS